MCPRCRRNAPLVYRGVAAYCAACGSPRLPLTSSSVTHAGQPSKVGGTVARVFGWIVLAVGLGVALLFGVGLFLLFPEGLAWLVVSAPITLLTVLFSWLLLRSGRGLQQIGEGEQKNARAKAIFALAQHRGGMVTANDVAQALDIRADHADALLTEMAKTTPDQVLLEVDDAGGIYYRFPQLLTAWQGHAVRVDAQAAPTRVAVPEKEAEVLEAEVVPPPHTAKRY
jgi:hypothetical protein